MSQWLKNYMKIKPTPEVDGVWMSLEYNMFGVPEKTEIIGDGIRNIKCDEDISPTKPPEKSCPDIRKKFDIHSSGIKVNHIYMFSINYTVQ